MEKILQNSRYGFFQGYLEWYRSRLISVKEEPDRFLPLTTQESCRKERRKKESQGKEVEPIDYSLSLLAAQNSGIGFAFTRSKTKAVFSTAWKNQTETQRALMFSTYGKIWKRDRFIQSILPCRCRLGRMS